MDEKMHMKSNQGSVDSAKEKIEPIIERQYYKNLPKDVIWMILSYLPPITKKYSIYFTTHQLETLSYFYFFLMLDVVPNSLEKTNYPFYHLLDDMKKHIEAKDELVVIDDDLVCMLDESEFRYYGTDNESNSINQDCLIREVSNVDVIPSENHLIKDSLINLYERWLKKMANDSNTNFRETVDQYFFNIPILLGDIDLWKEVIRLIYSNKRNTNKHILSLFKDGLVLACAIGELEILKKIEKYTEILNLPIEKSDFIYRDSYFSYPVSLLHISCISSGFLNYTENANLIFQTKKNHSVIHYLIETALLDPRSTGHVNISPYSIARDKKSSITLQLMHNMEKKLSKGFYLPASNLNKKFEPKALYYFECTEHRSLVEALLGMPEYKNFILDLKNNINDTVSLMLIKKILNTNQKGLGDCTLLHVAASENQVYKCLLFLEWGADINVKSSSGETPLLYAVRQSNFNTANVLLMKGADLNCLNKKGESVFDQANSARDEKIKDMLQLTKLVKNSSYILKSKVNYKSYDFDIRVDKTSSSIRLEILVQGEYDTEDFFEFCFNIKDDKFIEANLKKQLNVFPKQLSITQIKTKANNSICLSLSNASLSTIIKLSTEGVISVHNTQGHMKLKVDSENKIILSAPYFVIPVLEMNADIIHIDKKTECKANDVLLIAENKIVNTGKLTAEDIELSFGSKLFNTGKINANNIQVFGSNVISTGCLNAVNNIVVQGCEKIVKKNKKVNSNSQGFFNDNKKAVVLYAKKLEDLYFNNTPN